jgi:hypothetical protein
MQTVEITCQLVTQTPSSVALAAAFAFRIEGAVHDILHPIPSPLFASGAAATFEAREWGGHGSAIDDRSRFIKAGVVSFTISDDALARLAHSSFAARLEIRYAGTAYFRGEVLLSRPARKIDVTMSVVYAYGDNPPMKDPAGWSLRIISDPNLALRNFDCDQYWEGDVELPITLEP